MDKNKVDPFPIDKDYIKKVRSGEYKSINEVKQEHEKKGGIKGNQEREQE